MISEEGLKEIKSFAGDDGFWKSSAEGTLIREIQILMQLNVPEDVAISVVMTAFRVGCTEFGG